MSGVLRWEEPPKHGNTGRTNGRYQTIAAELRARPQEWGVVGEMATGQAGTTVYRIKRGRGAFAPAGAFEAVSRRGKDDGQAVVYARYVGVSA